MIERILVIASVTYLLRIAPFVLFGQGKHTPPWILYLGRFLPPAVMGMLVVYSLKSVHISLFNESLPVGLALFVTVSLHLWKRNNLLSIVGGTGTYMVMLQLMMGS